MNLGIVRIINLPEIVYIIVLWRLILSTCLGHGGTTDIWLNIILGVSVREEINIRICGLWKPLLRLIQSTEGLRRTKRWSRKNLLFAWVFGLGHQSCFQTRTWIGLYTICSPGSQIFRSGLVPWAMLGLQPAGCRSWDVSTSKTTWAHVYTHTHTYSQRVMLYIHMCICTTVWWLMQHHHSYT